MLKGRATTNGTPLINFCGLRPYVGLAVEERIDGFGEGER